MEVGDWITLAAVVVALGIGVASILHTRNMLKKERRERLLNEIIEWATKVYSMPWRFGNVFREVVKITSETDAYLFKIAHAAEMKESFVEFHGNNLYAKEISLNFADLHKASLKLISEYEKYVKLLEEYSTIVKKVMKSEAIQAEEQEAEGQLDSASFQINHYAYKVIQEATKLKTRDIS